MTRKDLPTCFRDLAEHGEQRLRTVGRQVDRDVTLAGYGSVTHLAANDGGSDFGRVPLKVEPDFRVGRRVIVQDTHRHPVQLVGLGTARMLDRSLVRQPHYRNPLPSRGPCSHGLKVVQDHVVAPQIQRPHVPNPLHRLQRPQGSSPVDAALRPKCEPHSVEPTIHGHVKRAIHPSATHPHVHVGHAPEKGQQLNRPGVVAVPRALKGVKHFHVKSWKIPPATPETGPSCSAPARPSRCRAQRPPLASECATLLGCIPVPCSSPPNLRC